MIEVDGSRGEGGGQIIRTSLSLAMVTGKAFRISNIRAKRSKPGLQKQHLTCVQAAAQMTGARVEGDHIGSLSITFEPGSVASGDYYSDVGTAGSTSLVFQTILYALLTEKEPSTVRLKGGTHNPFAPSADFLASTFLPSLRLFGPELDQIEIIETKKAQAREMLSIFLRKTTALLKPLRLWASVAGERKWWRIWLRKSTKTTEKAEQSWALTSPISSSSRWHFQLVVDSAQSAPPTTP